MVDSRQAQQDGEVVCGVVYAPDPAPASGAATRARMGLVGDGGSLDRVYSGPPFGARGVVSVSASRGTSSIVDDAGRRGYCK